MKKERNTILGVGLITVLLASCSQQPQSNLTVSGLDPQNFVADVKGKPTSLYTLKNSNGMEVCVTNFGGRIVSIMVPDKNDSLRDVVLGFDSIADYARARRRDAEIPRQRQQYGEHFGLGRRSRVGHPASDIGRLLWQGDLQAAAERALGRGFRFELRIGHRRHRHPGHRPAQRVELWQILGLGTLQRLRTAGFELRVGTGARRLPQQLPSHSRELRQVLERHQSFRPDAQDQQRRQCQQYADLGCTDAERRQLRQVLRRSDGEQPAGETDRQQRRLVQRHVQREFARGGSRQLRQDQPERVGTGRQRRGKGIIRSCVQRPRAAGRRL